MARSDFDDTDFEDDFDSFDDDFDDVDLNEKGNDKEESADRKKSSKSLVVPIVAVLALAGVSGVLYTTFLSSPDDAARVPVVDISSRDSAADPSGDDAVFDEPDLADAGEMVLSPDLETDAFDSFALDQTPAAAPAVDESVLTPLPDNVSQADIQLADIFDEEDSMQNPFAPQDSVAQDDGDVEIAAAAVALDMGGDDGFLEAEFQEKTESVAQDLVAPVVEAVAPLAEVVPPAPAPDVAVDAVPDAVQDELDQADATNIVPIETPAPVVPDVAVQAQAEITPVAAAPADVAQPAPKQVEDSAVVSVKPEPVKVVPKPVWSIRGAQSGRAVLRDANTGNVRSVEVEDRVEGLGRITAIDKIDGRWTVKGTQASVTR